MDEQETKPRRGRPPNATANVTETPEFKAAVAKAAADALSELLPTLKRARQEHGTEEEGGADPTWMRALAMEISQLTDQGTGRRRVAPEVLRDRQMAREKMTNLIVEARAAKKTATYRGELLGKIRVPEVVANVCFGGAKRNRLFICGTRSLYAIYLRTTGADGSYS
jgi:hypothetical protein